MKLGKKPKQSKDNSLKNYDMFGPEPWTRWFKSHKLLLVVLLLLIVIGLSFWYFKPSGHMDKATSTAELQTLQTSLKIALNSDDNTSVVQITDRLINGVKTGNFNINNSTLASYYMYNATSQVNLKNYAQAVPAYEQASKLDDSLKKAALQGDALARYNLGERQELIPLLQQIIQIDKKLTPAEDMGGTPAQYQYDIQQLQHGKDIQLP